MPVMSPSSGSLDMSTSHNMAFHSSKLWPTRQLCLVLVLMRILPVRSASFGNERFKPRRGMTLSHVALYL